jgi:hypothetical protein
VTTPGRSCCLLLGALACTNAASRVEGAASSGESAPAAPASASMITTGTPTLLAVEPAKLVVTSGSIDVDGPSHFNVRAPSLRAELGTEPRSAVEVDFVYRGPTKSDAPLASGELRRQIGLKLRASDSCNVVYVMWHIEPSPGIVVSVKRNPGQNRHSQCGDRGYTFLRPTRSKTLDPIAVGERHQLRATIDERNLRVVTDGVESWVGSLPPSAFEFDGPVGLRSDNGEFEVELRAPTAQPL